MWKELQSRRLKSAYNKISRLRFNCRGKVLCKFDAQAIASGFVLQEALLYDNLRLLGIDDPFDVIDKHLFDIAKEAANDFPGFITEEKELVSLLRGNFNWFELVYCAKSDALRHLIKDLSLICRLKAGPLEFMALHGYLNYMIKIPCGADDLEEESIEAWLQNDADLVNYVIGDRTGKARLVKTIITDWFHNYEPHLQGGPFSNGSTADCGVDICEKLQTRIPLSVRHTVMQYSIDELAYDLLQSFPTQEGKLPSKMRVVPKTAVSLRPICMEPASMNLMQGLLARDLVDYIHSHPVISRHVDLRDQQKSRSMAILASRTGRFCTVDLSSASDRVSYQQVEYLFGDTPVWPLLKTLRSDKAEVPNHGCVTLNKYASMGSMLCFIVETIVFAAICEASIRWASVKGSFDRSYRVYGDDIILPVEAYGVLGEIFDEFGYILNSSKSYAVGPFREACGVFAYEGVDVTTPTYPRGRQIHIYGNVIPRESSTILDLANDYFCNFGLGLYRYMLVAHLLQTYGGMQLFSTSSGENALLTYTPTNYKAICSSRGGIRRFRTYKLKPVFGIDYRKKSERDRLDLWLFLATTTEREVINKPSLKVHWSPCEDCEVLDTIRVPVGARVLDVRVQPFWRKSY